MEETFGYLIAGFVGALVGRVIYKIDQHFIKKEAGKKSYKSVEGTKIELIELDPEEKRRTYYYSDGTFVNIQNVTHFKDSKTTHRLKADGILHIIMKKDLRRIEIVAKEFTV